MTSSLSREDAALLLNIEGQIFFFASHQRENHNSHSGKQTTMKWRFMQGIRKGNEREQLPQRAR